MAFIANHERFKVLHALPMALPIGFGSSIRSKYIVEGQVNFAEPTVAVYPTYSEDQAELGNPAEINRISYYYLIDKNPLSRALYDLRISRPVMTRWHMRQFALSLQNITHRIKPDLIHAAAPYNVGIPAMYTARALGIPFIYEVRNLSEYDVLTDRKFNTHGMRYMHRQRSENYLLQNSEAIVAISENSRKEIVSRGVDASKVFTVLNGIEAESFVPRVKCRETLGKHSLKTNAFILGFVGNLKRIEGMELVVEALPSLAERIPDLVLLIVGDGPEVSVLMELVEKLTMGPYVTFTGRVPFDEIQKYYSIIDLFVLPRIKTKLSDIISPLKPLEAMAMEIPVLGSDVGGIQEIIKDEQNGFTFRAGDIHDFIKKTIFLYENNCKRIKVAKNGRDWVKEQRDWQKLVNQYDFIYYQASRNHKNALKYGNKL